MAKDVEIKIKVVNESGDIIEKTVKSMKELETESGKLKEALANAPIGSDKFKQLNDAAKETDKTLSKTKASTMSLGEQLGSVGGPLGGAVQGFQGMSKAAMGFIATPIGAIIAVIGVVLAAVTTAMKKNEAAMDALTKVTSIFGAIIQPIFDGLAWVAENVLGAFADGLAAVADFFGLAGSEAAKFADELDKQQDIEKDLAVSRAQTNKQLAAAKEILSDSNATYEQRTKALKKVQAAEEEQSRKEVANKRELLKLAQQDIKLNGASEEAIQKVRDAKIALANVEQDYYAKQRQFNKQQKALDKEVADKAKEQQAEAEAAAKAAADRAKARRDAAQSQLKEALAKEKAEKDAAYLLGIKDDEERARETLRIQQENADAELQVKIKSYTDKKKLTKDEEAALNALRAAANAQDLKQEAETAKLLEEQEKKAKEKKEAEEKKAAEDAKAKIDKDYADQLKALDNQNKLALTAMLDAGVSREKILEEQKQRELAILQEKYELAKKTYGLESQEAIDAALLVSQKEREILDADVKATEEAEKKKSETRRQQFDAIIQTAQAVTGALASIQEAGLQRELAAAGDNAAEQERIKKEYFEKGKKMQIANAIISTLQSGVQAFTSLSGIPVVGPVLGAIAAAAAVASGFANVSKIRNTQYEGGGGGGGGEGGGGNKFASGGMVTGPGTGTSDSIPARLSNGESVINARSTQMYGGLLSAINVAGGGKPFAEGGVATTNPVGMNMEAPIIKTYVVASDMTSQQEADAKIARLAQL